MSLCSSGSSTGNHANKSAGYSAAKHCHAVSQAEILAWRQSTLDGSRLSSKVAREDGRREKEMKSGNIQVCTYFTIFARHCLVALLRNTEQASYLSRRKERGSVARGFSAHLIRDLTEGRNVKVEEQAEPSNII